MRPRVSIVIPARNEERLLARTLAGIADLDYPKDRFEVIVVDNGSVDGTAAVARAAGAEVLVLPGVTVGALRNAGAARASGEVLAFLDADCVPDRQWLAYAVRTVSAERCVTGSRVAVPTDGSWIERAWFGENPGDRRPVSYINSGNLIVPRDVFQEIGGFDPGLQTGEDSEFCRRARRFVPIVADDAIRVVHLGNPKTLPQFFRREAWHGMGALAPDARSLRNLPLIGALTLAMASAGQVAGLVLWLAGRQPWLLIASSVLIVLLLAASALHRARSARSPMRLARLGVLYYTYYLGRAWALVRLAARLPSIQRAR